MPHLPVAKGLQCRVCQHASFVSNWRRCATQIKSETVMAQAWFATRVERAPDQQGLAKPPVLIVSGYWKNRTIDGYRIEAGIAVQGSGAVFRGRSCATERTQGAAFVNRYSRCCTSL